MNRFIDEIAQLLPIDPVKKLDKLTVLRVAVDTVKHLKGRSDNFNRSIDNQLRFGLKQVHHPKLQPLVLANKRISMIMNYWN